MPVAVVITDPAETHPGLHWAFEFSPPGEPVMVFTPVIESARDILEPRPLSEIPEGSSTLLTNLQESVATICGYPAPASPAPPPAVIHTLEVAAASRVVSSNTRDEDRLLLCEVRRRNAVDEILAAVGRYKISLLVIPQTVAFQRGEPVDDARLLFTRAHCRTVLLRPVSGVRQHCQRILVATSGGVHSREALQLACAMAGRHRGRVTALYVEPPIDVVAPEVGRRELARIIGQSVGPDRKVEQKVVVGKRILEAVAEEAHAGYDLLLIGTSNHGFLRRALFGTIPERLLTQGAGPTVAVVRRAIPFTRRLRQAMRQRVERWVPQLDREMRVSFVESLQNTSRLGFDFVALICLSTVIAALGLIRNSGAVVIGAMLVAPLMTPLIASGLSLVQGNWHLIRIASRTVFGGFVLAFGIGLILGLSIPGLTATDEMLSRGSPSAFDLLVALVSGMAAAYAGSRPHLISALPGVAIAASLIPPVATSGMAAAIGNWPLASGSLLLFLTNIVAIVLGTAVSLWAVGVRGGDREPEPRRWVIGVSLVLVLTALGLGYYELTPHLNMPSAMTQQVHEAIAEHPDVELLASEPTWSRLGGTGLHLVVAAPGPLPEKLAARLQEFTSYYGVECSIEVRLRQRIPAIPGDNHREEPR